jgi:sec-independent protein translocase protein TatC
MANPAQPEPRTDPAEHEEGGAKMSFFDHLTELRKRLLYSVAAIGVGLCVGLYYSQEAYTFLAKPMLKALREAKMEDKLVYTSPLGPLHLFITVGLYLGIVFALPYVLYQVWLFVAPGLYRHERRAVAAFIIFSVGLFLAGMAFGYWVLMPMTLGFLLSVGTSGQFRPMISMNDYFDMTLVIELGLGLIFQLPILIFFLSLFGIVTPRFLWNNFRYAVLIISIIAAVVTPTTDALTMTIFMAPMILLYLLGIGVSALVVRRKRRAEAIARASAP